MDTGDRFENESAAREARDSVVNRPAGSRRSATAEALKRYLGAQIYRDRDPARERNIADKKDDQPREG